MQAPDAGLQTPAVWHWSAAVHTTGFPPAQAPASQVSVCVPARRSSDRAPLSMGGLVQPPDAGLQTPAVWHWSVAVHTTGFPPTQAPAWQVSVCVQALPSSHDAPSSLGGLVQVPDAGLQTPAVWHWSAAVHTTGFPPAQAPASQVSVCVQGLPSSHGAPLSLGGLVQPPDAGVQAPAGRPLSSSHDAPSSLAGLLQAPVAGLQVPAAWHWSEGLHTTGVPTQTTP